MHLNENVYQNLTLFNGMPVVNRLMTTLLVMLENCT